MVLGRLDPFRRRQALLDGFVIGVGSGGADHAHPDFVGVAEFLKARLFVAFVEVQAHPGFGMDHVDGDMDVGVRFIEVLDDHDLPLLGLQDFDHFKRGFEHVRLAGWSSGCQFSEKQ